MYFLDETMNTRGKNFIDHIAFTVRLDFVFLTPTSNDYQQLNTNHKEAAFKIYCKYSVSNIYHCNVDS